MPPFVPSINGSSNLLITITGASQTTLLMGAPIIMKNNNSNEKSSKVGEAGGVGAQSIETVLQLVAELREQILQKDAYIATLERRLGERNSLLRHSSTGLTTSANSSTLISPALMEELQEDVVGATATHAPPTDEEEDDLEDKFVATLPSGTSPRQRTVQRTATPAMGQMKAMQMNGMQQQANGDAIIEEEEDADEEDAFDIAPLVSSSVPRKTVQRTSTPAVADMATMRGAMQQQHLGEEPMIEEEDEDEDDEEEDNFMAPLPVMTVPRKTVQRTSTPAVAGMAAMRGAMQQHHLVEEPMIEEEDEDQDDDDVVENKPPAPYDEKDEEEEEEDDFDGGAMASLPPMSVPRQTVKRTSTPAVAEMKAMQMHAMHPHQQQEQHEEMIEEGDEEDDVVGQLAPAPKQEQFKRRLLRNPSPGELQPVSLPDNYESQRTLGTDMSNSTKSFDSFETADDSMVSAAMTGALPMHYEETPVSSGGRRIMQPNHSHYKVGGHEVAVDKHTLEVSLLRRPESDDEAAAPPTGQRRNKPADIQVSPSHAEIVFEHPNFRPSSTRNKPKDVVMPSRQERRSNASRRHLEGGTSPGGDICFDPSLLGGDDDGRSAAMTINTAVRDELRGSLNQSGRHIRDLPRERELEDLE